eukprot:CFRG7273T1
MSSSYSLARSSKLTLKGDATKKGKSKKSKSKKRKAENEIALAVVYRHGKFWQGRTSEDVIGPVILQFNTTGRYLFATETAKLVLGAMTDPTDTNGPDPAEIFTVVQLGDNKVALKSGYDRYIGTNTHGKLTGYAEAVGQLETWEFIMEDGIVRLKSSIGKFLGTDEDHVNEDGELIVGCYSKEATDGTDLVAWCGSERKVKKNKVDKYEGNVAQLEVAQAKRFQSFNGLKGNVITYQGDMTELKDAKKTGTLNEALLDRRTKVKADRYCK